MATPYPVEITGGQSFGEGQQDFLVQFGFIFPSSHQEIALFWYGRHFGEGQPNSSEKKCHSHMKTLSTAFNKFEMSAFMGRFDFWPRMR
jgi:hypothetical protein